MLMDGAGFGGCVGRSADVRAGLCASGEAVQAEAVAPVGRNVEKFGVIGKRFGVAVAVAACGGVAREPQENDGAVGYGTGERDLLAGGFAPPVQLGFFQEERVVLVPARYFDGKDTDACGARKRTHARPL